ncbi:MAG: hypothetical protein WCK02_12320 [Bacteroidota bacterium]
MIETIRKIADNDIIITIAFIGTISFTIKTIISFFTTATKVVKHKDSKRHFTDSLISIVLTFLGLACPILLSFKAISDWSGLLLWLTLILCGYVVFNFIMLVYMIASTLFIFNKKPKC